MFRTRFVQNRIPHRSKLPFATASSALDNQVTKVRRFSAKPSQSTYAFWATAFIRPRQFHANQFLACPFLYTQMHHHSTTSQGSGSDRGKSIEQLTPNQKLQNLSDLKDLVPAGIATYKLKQANRFQVFLHNGHMVWRSSTPVNGSDVKDIVRYVTEKLGRSIHINTGTHGRPDGTIVSEGNECLGEAGFAEQDITSSYFGNDKVSLHIVSKLRPPITPGEVKAANMDIDVIDAWCYSINTPQDRGFDFAPVKDFAKSMIDTFNLKALKEGEGSKPSGAPIITISRSPFKFIGAAWRMTQGNNGKQVHNSSVLIAGLFLIFGFVVLAIVYLILFKDNPNKIPDENEKKNLNNSKFEPVPGRTNFFVGRSKEKNDLKEQIQPGKIVGIVAAGGMGKSALTKEVKDDLEKTGELQKRFSESIYIDCYENPNIESAIQQIIDRLNPKFKRSSSNYMNIRASDLLKELTRLLSQKEVLIIFDGAEAFRNKSVTQKWNLLDIFKNIGRSGVLLSTRESSDLPSWATITNLPPLSESESLELFRRKIEVPENVLLNKDELDLCKKILTFLGGLPLAIKIASANAKNNGLREYFEKIQASPLGALVNNDEIEQTRKSYKSIEILLSISLKGVGDLERKVLGLIGILAFSSKPSISIEAFEKGLEISRSEILKAINHLKDLSLVKRDQSNRVSPSHLLVKTYAETNFPVSIANFENVAQYYLSTIKPDLDNLETDWSHIYSLISRSKKDNDTSNKASRTILILTDILAKYYSINSSLNIASEVADIGLGFCDSNDPEYKAIFYLRKSQICESFGNTLKSQEYLDTAFTFSKNNFELYYQKARIAYRVGNFEKAEIELGHAKECATTSVEHLRCDMYLGFLNQERGDNGEGFQYLLEAIRIYQKIYYALKNYQKQERTGEVDYVHLQILRGLAKSHTLLGYTAIAKKYNQKTFELFENSDLEQSYNIGLSAFIETESGEILNANNLFLKAFEYSVEIGDKRGQAFWSGGVACTYNILGQKEKAFFYQKKCLSLLDELNEKTHNERRMRSGIDQTEKWYISIIPIWTISLMIRLKNFFIRVYVSTLVELKESKYKEVLNKDVLQ